MKDLFRIISSLFFITLISVTCGRQSAPPKEDYAPPIIIDTTPDNQSLDNNINTAITVLFNERIDPASVTSETITVSAAMNGALVERDIACAGAEVILNARSPLQIFTVYVVHVTTGVKDIAGNAMLNPVTFTFTTGSQGDSTSPDISETVPEHGAVGVGLNTTIGITFTEPMLASTISATPSPLTVSTGTTTVAGSIISLDGSTVIFAPVNPLDYATTYTVTISDSVTDLAGNHPLWGNSYMWDFSTRMPTQDIMPPIVLSTTPANAATNVSVHAPVVAVFNESILESSLTSSTFLLTELQSGGPVPGQVSVVSGATALFTPANSLKYATDYLVTLITHTEGAAISDIAGNLLVPNSSQGYTWSFKTEPAILTVTKAGTGNGLVSADTGTFTWIGNTGTAVYTEYGIAVTLTAAASEGSTFSGWSGEECAGTGTCTVSMTAARNVTAIFTPSSTYSLTVTRAGTGGGIVSASTGTLTWTGNTGTVAYPDYGTQVILTAIASPESTFTGWSGACSGTGSCTVIMTEARSVTAAFMYDSYLLTVARAGTGSGLVSADAGTIAWLGNTGTAVYTDYGMPVTLAATASEGSTFAGWSGEECTGTGTCTVIMTAARSVSATFTIYTYPLAVTKNGKGTGVVTVNIGTLTWAGKTGTAIYNYNTQVVVTATADPGSIFEGWTNCEIVSGNQCTLSMTAAQAVSVTFNK
jgi:hypothetical protein